MVMWFALCEKDYEEDKVPAIDDGTTSPKDNEIGQSNFTAGSKPKDLGGHL